VRRLLFVVVTAWFTLPGSSSAQQNFDTVQVRSQKIAEGVYMLTGAGGNIGLAIGDDAVFVVDDQYAPLTPKILAAIAQLTNKPVRFVVNTHWHWDHTGGNENMGKAGALIVAHDNVRRRLSTQQILSFFNDTVPPSPAGALPVITFSDTVTFHINGDDVQAFHVAHAHTDGDAFIVWRKANVAHTGDVYFAGRFPFIDLDSGGSIDGLIAAIDVLLTLGDESIKIIPGHGPISDRAGVREYRAMLKTVRDRVSQQKAAGRTLAQTLATRPTSGFDERWGTGFIKPDQFVGFIYNSLPAPRR
jgi:glyoxylase-like metal-dependent hydrolase (beta-lactamase superfamily II)